MLQQPEATAAFLHVTLLNFDYLNVTAADVSYIDKTTVQRVMCGSYCQLILDLKALTKCPKPGGYALHQARDMVSLAKSTQHPRHALLAEAVEEQIRVHQEWCNRLKPILVRYIFLICTQAESAIYGQNLGLHLFMWTCQLASNSISQLECGMRDCCMLTSLRPLPVAVWCF